MEEDKKQGREALFFDVSQNSIIGAIDEIQGKNSQEISCVRREKAENEAERIGETRKYTNEGLSYLPDAFILSTIELYHLLIMAFVSQS